MRKLLVIAAILVCTLACTRNAVTPVVPPKPTLVLSDNALDEAFVIEIGTAETGSPALTAVPAEGQSTGVPIPPEVLAEYGLKAVRLESRFMDKDGKKVEGGGIIGDQVPIKVGDRVITRQYWIYNGDKNQYLMMRFVRPDPLQKVAQRAAPPAPEQPQVSSPSN